VATELTAGGQPFGHHIVVGVRRSSFVVVVIVVVVAAVVVVFARGVNHNLSAGTRRL